MLQQAINPASTGVRHEASARKGRRVSFSPTTLLMSHSSEAVSPPRWNTRNRSPELFWLKARVRANDRGRSALNRQREYVEACTTIFLQSFLTSTGSVILRSGLSSGGSQKRLSCTDIPTPPAMSGFRALAPSTPAAFAKGLATMNRRSQFHRSRVNRCSSKEL